MSVFQDGLVSNPLSALQVELFYDVPPDYPAATFEQAKGGLAGKLKSAPEGKLCGKVIFHTHAQPPTTHCKLR